MNRKSIGIETCHPDWGGRFNDVTYNSLVELTAELCKEYGIGINNVIRHHDITGKDCPKYYVENPNEWNKFKQDVQKRINGKEIVHEPERSDEPVRVYKNGSTREDIFADTNLTNKIGSLSPYESCDCFGEFNGRAIVRYHVDNTRNYKIGFAKWLGGIK